MLFTQATDVRKNWSAVYDSVIHERPRLIKRTRDELWMINANTLNELLQALNYSASQYVENDGTITLSLDDIDLVENGDSLEKAKLNLGAAILEYANEYYENFQLYSLAPDRKAHLPYVMKALSLNDPHAIGGFIKCRAGQN